MSDQFFYREWLYGAMIFAAIVGAGIIGLLWVLFG